MKYPILVCLPVLFIYKISFAQLITSDEAVKRALEKSPLYKSAGLQVEQQKAGKKGSFNLDDPELLIESPTGEFMTLGVEQSIAFPTVYIKQGQLAKQKAALAEAGRILTAGEVIHKVRSAYLKVQYNAALFALLQKQDSIYEALAVAAGRQFNAGQIDYVARTFSSTQQGDVNINLRMNEGNLHASLFELKSYMGTTDTVITEPLLPFEYVTADAAAAESAPVMSYQRQAVAVAGKSLEIERNKLWPSFTVGYLNPGGSDVDIPMRMRAGIAVPLWFWKYTASIKSAKLNVDIVNQAVEAEKQQLLINLAEQQQNLLQYQAALNYYNAKGNKDADDLAASSGRMFEAGQTDYLTYLRTLNEAYALKIKHLETVRNFNQAVINMKYLTGEQ